MVMIASLKQRGHYSELLDSIKSVFIITTNIAFFLMNCSGRARNTWQAHLNHAITIKIYFNKNKGIHDLILLLDFSPMLLFQ